MDVDWSILAVVEEGVGIELSDLESESVGVANSGLNGVNTTLFSHGTAGRGSW